MTFLSIGYLWGTCGDSMGTLWGHFDLWGTYGVPMGHLWAAVAAVWDLWGYGVGRVLVMGLRRSTYGDLFGFYGHSMRTF